MASHEPETPFPPAMQGRWVEVEDPSYEVVIKGSEMLWLGTLVAYQAMTITTEEDGSVAVELGFGDDIEPDDRPIYSTLVTGLDGELFAFNVAHGVVHLIRPSP